MSLTFQEFKDQAIPVKDQTDNPLFAFVGLGGEVGEFLNVRKKLERDGPHCPVAQFEQLKHDLIEEAGDVLFYLQLALEKEGLTLEEAASYVLGKLASQRSTQHPHPAIDGPTVAEREGA